jgi:tetratricopeptide (TPR) repeat protein
VTEIARELPFTRVELHGFTLDETAALVTERGGGAPQEVDVGALAARTGGNPFFLEALVDAGLTGAGGELPAGVAELVAARVGWLGERVGALLESAAVLGREFDVEQAAEVAGMSSEEALAALDSAAHAQLVVRSGARMAFVHALVQEALERSLGPSTLLQLHAGAADALEARGLDEAAARHALAALPLVPAERAADLAERAGAALAAAFAPDDAAVLLRRAVDLCDEAGAAPELRARLRCALGETLHAADRSDDARAVFDEAAALARQLGEGPLLARAALGSAGPAVTIVRVDRERVEALDEALEALPAGEQALRARLQARLAIELAYAPDSGRRERLSAESLAAARGATDPQTLAAALGARHVVLWGPDYTRERLALADEMVALARRAGDPALELQGRTWRIVDLDELGEGALVEQEIDAYAATAARSRLSAYGWYVPAWRGVRALLRGSVPEGRELLRHAIELGRDVGDPNAHFATRIEWVTVLADQRADELDLAWQEERVRNSPAGWAYRAMYTWALAAGGRGDDARRELAAQRAVGAPGSWPRDTNWLSALKELSEVAFLLRERELGAEIFELLEPFDDRIVASARSFMFGGSVLGALGRVAQLAGDPGRAVALYERGIERDERAGLLIWAMHHRRRLAEALLDAGERERGLELLARVEAEGPPMGLMRLAELARERRASE